MATRGARQVRLRVVVSSLATFRSYVLMNNMLMPHQLDFNPPTLACVDWGYVADSTLYTPGKAHKLGLGLGLANPHPNPNPNPNPNPSPNPNPNPDQAHKYMPPEALVFEEEGMYLESDLDLIARTELGRPLDRADLPEGYVIECVLNAGLVNCHPSAATMGDVGLASRPMLRLRYRASANPSDPDSEPDSGRELPSISPQADCAGLLFDIVDGRPESEDVLVWQNARFEDYKYAARREPVGLVWSPMDKAELASRGYPEPTVQSGRTCVPKV